MSEGTCGGVRMEDWEPAGVAEDVQWTPWSTGEPEGLHVGLHVVYRINLITLQKHYPFLVFLAYSLWRKMIFIAGSPESLRSHLLRSPQEWNDGNKGFGAEFLARQGFLGHRFTPIPQCFLRDELILSSEKYRERRALTEEVYCDAIWNKTKECSDKDRDGFFRQQMAPTFYIYYKQLICDGQKDCVHALAGLRVSGPWTVEDPSEALSFYHVDVLEEAIRDCHYKQVIRLLLEPWAATLGPMVYSNGIYRNDVEVMRWILDKQRPSGNKVVYYKYGDLQQSFMRIAMGAAPLEGPPLSDDMMALLTNYGITVEVSGETHWQ